MKRISLFLIVCIIGSALGPLFVLGENESLTQTQQQEIELLSQRIREKQEKVKQLEQSIEEYKKKINTKRLEAVSLSNQIGILDNRLAQTELAVESTAEKLDIVNLEIENLDYTITKKEQDIVRQQDIITQLIQTLHREGNKTYLEIASVYDSFSDFYNQVQYVKTIEKDLGYTLQGVRVSKEELEEKEAEAQERKGSFEKLKEEMAAKKEELEQQTFLKQDLLAQTHASELTYKTLLSNLRAQYQQIENEITGIEREVRRKLEEQDRMSRLDTLEEGDQFILSWPTQSRYVTARFHDPDYPFRHIFEHNAIDIRASQGTPIKATASGYIARAKRCDSAACYSYIMIVHNEGFSTVYGHISTITVTEDQFVTRGDVIGYSGGMPGTVGAGPFVTGPHLHFEVRKNGIPVNPLTFLVKDY